MKKVLEPFPMIYPLPATLVSCGNEKTGLNIITIAWTGTICSNPAMCYISVQPKRYSYPILKETGAFVINLSTKELAHAADWCGMKSGRDYDKFKETGLTAIPATRVDAPIIKESPLNIECAVTEIKTLGSHDMFIAKVMAIHCDEHCMDLDKGQPDPLKLDLISYTFRTYHSRGEFLGRGGYAIKS